MSYDKMRAILEKECPSKTLYTDIDTLDISDSKSVNNFFEQNELTHVINCAAYTAVDKAESDQTMCYKINVEAVQNIAKAAAKHGIKVVHIATDYVFDGKSYRPYTEGNKANPTSTYGTTKRKGEMILLSFCPDAVIVRTAWLYSPHGHNFVKTMMKLGREKSELRVVFDQIGTPTSATDLAAAIFAILKSRQWISGTYHFSNEGVASWYDFAKAIHRIAGITNCNIIPVTTADYPTPATRPNYSVLDKSMIKRTFGIKIPYWEDSLKECIARINEQE